MLLHTGMAHPKSDMMLRIQRKMMKTDLHHAPIVSHCFQK